MSKNNKNKLKMEPKVKIKEIKSTEMVKTKNRSFDSEMDVVEVERSEDVISIISINSSEPETPKKKLCLVELPSTKKKITSSRKKKLKLDGLNCRKITDFFNSGKCKTSTNNGKRKEAISATQPVTTIESPEEGDSPLEIVSYTQPIASSKDKVKRNLLFNSPVQNRRLFKNIENVPKINTKSKDLKVKKIPPPYKIIEGTSFAVDAFSFGEIEGITHYFLTHFHADHYIGLKKSFDFPIYMTQITADLVQTFIKVDPKFYRILKLNEPCIIGDCTVEAIDANHCPGAAMLLFTVNGKSILHTGDFRACPSMEEDPLFWNCDLDLIYLDTTYLTSKSQHCSQNESIKIAIEIISKYKEKHIGEKILIICGAYLIGKEKLWLKIAEKFKTNIWTEPKRRQALKCLENKKINNLLIEKKEEAGLHILSMGKGLMYENIVKYVSELEDYFTHAIVIKPSGWEFNSKPRIQGNLTIIGVEYSEHSSFEELKRFVRFLRPKQVISTVPIGRGAKTPKVPESWYLGEIKAHTKRQQQAITNFMIVTQKENVLLIPDLINTSVSDDKSDWMS